MIKKGDTAEYGCTLARWWRRFMMVRQRHWIMCHFLNSGKLIAIGGETLRFRKRNNSMLPHECVIIGPACVLLPVGASV